MKPFLASPNETIEAASQKLKLKNGFRRKRHKLSKPKRNAAAPKKRSPNECACQPFHRCSHNRGVCQHKVPFFNQRSTRLSSCVIMPESKIIHRFFSTLCWHWGGTVISLQNHNIFRSLNWIQWVPPFPQYREKSNAPVCDQSKRLLVCTTSNIKIPGARGYTSSKGEI